MSQMSEGDKEKIREEIAKAEEEFSECRSAASDDQVEAVRRFTADPLPVGPGEWQAAPPAMAPPPGAPQAGPLGSEIPDAPYSGQDETKVTPDGKRRNVQTTPTVARQLDLSAGGGNYAAAGMTTYPSNPVLLGQDLQYPHASKDQQKSEMERILERFVTSNEAFKHDMYGAVGELKGEVSKLRDANERLPTMVKTAVAEEIARNAEFKAVQNSVKEVEGTVGALKRSNRIFKDALQAEQLKGVKLMSRITGVPHDTSVADIKASEHGHLLSQTTKMQMWRRRTGEGVGVCDCWWPSLEVKEEMMKKWRAARPQVKGRDAYMGSVSTAIGEQYDRPLRSALRDLKGGWTGDKRSLRIVWRSRSIECASRTIVTQCEDSWDLRWYIDKKDATSEEAVRNARALDPQK